MCIYIFSLAALFQVFFLNSFFYYKYYKAIGHKDSLKYVSRILKLKKISICLFLLNFGIIRFNILSPSNFKIYYKENKFMEKIIYSCLGLYFATYLISWGYDFYKFKKITLNYNKLK